MTQRASLTIIPAISGTGGPRPSGFISPSRPLIREGTALAFVDIIDVQKWFNRLHVLKGVNLSIREQEVVVVCGPSGSGKSTLLRCVNHLETVTSGRVVVDGDEIGARHVDVNALRREIGMVFQQFNDALRRTDLCFGS